MERNVLYFMLQFYNKRSRPVDKRSSPVDKRSSPVDKRSSPVDKKTGGIAARQKKQVYLHR
jgi:hypothetical protein